ncbi:DUF7167 family protein [Rahnella bonaserana]|jgi:hypothetical protein
MSEVMIKISTTKVGSEVRVGTGIEKEEWLEMSEKEQTEILSDIVWENINAYADL